MVGHLTPPGSHGCIGALQDSRSTKRFRAEGPLLFPNIVADVFSIQRETQEDLLDPRRIQMGYSPFEQMFQGENSSEFSTLNVDEFLLQRMDLRRKVCFEC